MISDVEATLDSVVAHYIGSHIAGEDITFSKAALTIEDEALYQILFKYFLVHFKEPEYFKFTFSSYEIALNPIYNFVSNIFDDPSCIHEQSVKIARHLFEKSKHPNIKPGELYISYFSNILVDDEMVDAVGIFKSESKDLFLKLETNTPEFKLTKESGTHLGKIDKGCLILNVDRENGFKICNIDHSNRYKEAQYWRDDFLIIRSCNDSYHNTKNYIQATKEFISQRMPKEFDTDKSDQADMMNRSFEYFKIQENFEVTAYETKVFKNGKVLDAFQDYKQEFEENRAITLADSFEISDFALKKQARVFKSIIKLDKNFHIYVHGDKNKIMKGVDDHGKKYYILYYEDEN